MNREKELTKNTIILIIGNFLPKFSSFITLPIITGVLTKVEYGTYDLISTLVLLFIPIVTLQIHSAAFRFLIEQRGNIKGESEVVTNLFVAVFGFSLISFIILYCSLYKYALGIRLLICSYFFVNIIFLAMQQVIRGFSKNILYSVSSICTSLLNTLFIVIMVAYVFKGLIGVILSTIIAMTFGCAILFGFGKIIKYINIRLVNKQLIKQMIQYSWPLVPNSLSNWVLSVSDRMVLYYFIGIEATAVYAVANKIPSLLGLVQSSYVFAWQESASLAIEDKDANEYYSNMFNNIFRIVCGVMAVLISFTPILFRLLINGDYLDAYYHMPILFLGMFFSLISSFFGGIYTAHKKTLNVGLSTIIAAVINIVIDLSTVRLIGIYAASISTMISYMVLAIYRMIDIRKFQKIKYDLKKIVFYISILLCLCLLCFANIFIINCINFVVGIIIGIVFNKSLIKKVFASIIKMLNKGKQ